MIKLAIIIHLAASLANPGAAVREATLAAREISTAAGIELQISEAITEDLPPLDLWQGGPVSPTALYLIQEIATLPPEKRIHLYLIPPDVTFYGEEVPAGAAVMSTWSAPVPTPSPASGLLTRESVEVTPAPLVSVQPVASVPK